MDTSSDDTAGAASPGAVARRLRWGVVAGLVVGVVLVVFTVQLSLAVLAPATYRRTHLLFANGPGRVLLGAVAVAMVFHLCDGVRRLVVQTRPQAEDRGRVVVHFCTAALSLPVVLSILWPSVGWWFA